MSAASATCHVRLPLQTLLGPSGSVFHQYRHASQHRKNLRSRARQSGAGNSTSIRSRRLLQFQETDTVPMVIYRSQHAILSGQVSESRPYGSSTQQTVRTEGIALCPLLTRSPPSRLRRKHRGQSESETREKARLRGTSFSSNVVCTRTRSSKGELLGSTRAHNHPHKSSAQSR